MVGLFKGLFEEIENSYFDSEFDLEFDSESDSKKSEQKFNKSIAETVKLGIHKYNELNELITKNGKTEDKELFKRYFECNSLGDMQAE